MKKKISMNEIKNVVKEEIMKELNNNASEPQYDLSFLNDNLEGTFGDYGDDSSEEMSQEEQEELFRKTDEIAEFTGYIYSNVDSLRDIVNENFQEDSEAKTEIMNSLKIIEEQVDLISNKTYELR